MLIQTNEPHWKEKLHRRNNRHNRPSEAWIEVDAKRWTHIYPSTNKQKNLLLQQKAVKQYQISCSLCKSEQEVRGVIYNVTSNNTEEELLSLQHQGVKEVKIFAKQRLKNTTVISTMVTLYFNPTTLQREVIITHEVFLAKKIHPKTLPVPKVLDIWTSGRNMSRCPSIKNLCLFPWRKPPMHQPTKMP